MDAVLRGNPAGLSENELARAMVWCAKAKLHGTLFDMLINGTVDMRVQAGEPDFEFLLHDEIPDSSPRSANLIQFPVKWRASSQEDS